MGRLWHTRENGREWRVSTETARRRDSAIGRSSIKLGAAGNTNSRDRTMRRRDVLSLGLSSLSSAIVGAPFASAQGKFPDGPIRFVVPRAAGGVVDVVARLWAEQVKPTLGNVVIENQGGEIGRASCR